LRQPELAIKVEVTQTMAYIVGAESAALLRAHLLPDCGYDTRCDSEKLLFQT